MVDSNADYEGRKIMRQVGRRAWLIPIEALYFLVVAAGLKFIIVGQSIECLCCVRMFERDCLCPIPVLGSFLTFEIAPIPRHPRRDAPSIHFADYKA